MTVNSGLHPSSMDQNASHGSTVTATILTTKLYRPTISEALESRAELIARLEDNHRARALSLITAPTGYGKSTLASMWLDASETPGCWISLDEDDNDPHSFLRYVVAAIQSVAPEISLNSQALVAASTFPPAATVAHTLLNDLEKLPQRILLVMDDLHVIRTQAVHDILGGLLRHPSSRMHLVLISRSDPPLPIASLRAYRLVTEVRARDLRFSMVQTAGLLSKVLRRHVDEATAALWMERTEGWVSALHLAAIALRDSESHDLELDDIPVDSHYIQGYLLAEILNRLDPMLKVWLFVIARLDRFCPALCTAVAQPDLMAAQSDLTGEEFVQWLRRENLFIVSLDSENCWFRFHHLFQRQLQILGEERLQGAEIAMIHRHAGTWFAQANLIDEAVRQFALAEDFAAAEVLVVRHRYDLMDTEQWHRLEGWLRHFPKDVQEGSAVLMTTIAILGMHGRGFDSLEPAYRRAEQLLANLSADSSTYNLMLGELSVIGSFLAIGAGKVEAVTTGSRRGVQLLPANALDLRAIAWGEMAVGMQMSGRFAEGYHLLQGVINERHWTRTMRVRLMDYLCMICFMEGDLNGAHAWADRVRIDSEELQLAERLGHARYFLGAIHYLRCESEAAEPYLSALLKDQASSPPTFVAMGAIIVALLKVDQGDSEQAVAITDQITTYMRQLGDSSALTLLEALDVELALRRGDIRAAAGKQVGVDFGRRPPLWFHYIPQLTPIKFLLAKGTQEALHTARLALEDYEAQMASIHRNSARIETLALLVSVYEAQGDTAAVETSLNMALDLAREGQIIRPFVEQGRTMADLLKKLLECDDETFAADRDLVFRILAAQTSSISDDDEQMSSEDYDIRTAKTADRALKPLTSREVQILQMLATDCTPQQIAAQNVVAISTVRSQIKSIYRKLDVNSRIEAVNRGRELTLL